MGGRVLGESDLDVEASKNVESFGVGQDNHATRVGIVYFLLSIRLVVGDRKSSSRLQHQGRS